MHVAASCLLSLLLLCTWSHRVHLPSPAVLEPHLGVLDCGVHAAKPHVHPSMPQASLDSAL